MNLKSIKKLPAVYRLLSLLRKTGGRAWMRAQYRLRGVQKKTVLFTSFKGRACSDSPRFISEALHALRPDVDIVWQLANPADAPEYARTVKPRSLAALTELATARCFVDNFNRPIYLEKYPGQLYVQTWHGDRGFKKIMYDMNDGLPYPDGELMDLAVSGSEFGTGVYRSAFRYAGEVMELGLPRNDLLVGGDPDRAKQVRRRLGIPMDAMVMLCAPTFRDANAGGAMDAGFDLSRALTALEAGTGRKWLCLTRAHDKNRGIAAPSAMDVTRYPEMAELLLISDLLITDYSSAAGDFVLTGRPAILYQPDLNAYISEDRGLYFDIRTSPFLRAESEGELMNLLKDFSNLPDRSREILDFFRANETGHAAQSVAEWISARIDQ